jgi:hypothetical protein
MAWIRPGSLLILLAHLGLRPAARRVDRLPSTTETEVETSYLFRAVCQEGDEAHISRLSLEPSVTSVSWNVCELTVLTAAGE